MGCVSDPLVALLFPGQGSQYVGMGKDLFSGWAAARSVYEEASDAAGFDVGRLSFEGPEEALARTENCQPAVLATSMACLRVLEEEMGGLKPCAAAGHSLGEYTALVAAGSLDFGEAVGLVRERGRLMEQASESSPGGMVAVLGAGVDTVEEACASCTGTVSVANLNAPGQVVISGEEDALEEASGKLKKAGAKRLVRLSVSGPFHTVLMRPVEERLAELLDEVRISKPAFPVFANVTAAQMKTPEEIRRLLALQVSSPVRWSDEVEALLELGDVCCAEVGPGKVLRGLLGRIAGGVQAVGVSDGETARAAGRSLAARARQAQQGAGSGGG